MRGTEREGSAGRKTATAALTSWVALTAGCGGDSAPDRAGPTVLDSAGIEIVENPAGPGGEGERWTVTAEPDRVVGALEGDPATLLDRVASPTLRRDGVLVLANRGTNQVRAFGPDGVVLWQAGGEGDGPGEFRSLSAVGLLPGDSVYAYDARNRRVTVFAPDGALVRTFAAGPPAGAVMAAPVGAFDDGRFLATGGVSFSGGEGAAREFVWPSASYYLVAPDGAVLDSVTAVPSLERMVFREGGSVGIVDLPFGRSGFVAARGRRIVSGRSQAVDLDVRDSDGAPLRRVRLDLPRTPPPADAVERAVEAQAGPDPGTVRELLDLVGEAPLPEHLPLADGVALEADGTIWLRLWQPPWDEGPRRWRVFDPAGLDRGEVVMPAGFQLSSIEGDRLVGVHRDALDVEQIRVYALNR